MIKRYLITIFLVLLVAGGLLVCFISAPTPETEDTIELSTQKADDDFTDLFRLADTRGDTLAAVTVTKVETVSDVIEKYEVTDTSYTKVTVNIDRDFTGRQTAKTATIMILGTAENFPSREVLNEGNGYILRLEPWAHESGLIYLVSPLESTYLRLHDGKVLVRKSADLPNYSPACSPDEFAAKLSDYRKENPVDDAVLSKHYKEMLSVIENYDYAQKELAYKPLADAIAARLALAKDLAK